MHRFIRLLLLFLLLICGQAFPAPLLLQATESGQRADGFLSLLRDPAGELTLAGAMSQEFQTLPGQASLGFTPDAIWLRLVLQSKQTGEWWLEMGLPSLDDIRVFHQDTQGICLDQLIAAADAAMYEAKHAGRNRHAFTSTPA